MVFNKFLNKASLAVKPPKISAPNKVIGGFKGYAEKMLGKGSQKIPALNSMPDLPKPNIPGIIKASETKLTSGLLVSYITKHKHI